MVKANTERGIIDESEARRVLEPFHSLLFSLVRRAWTDYQAAAEVRRGVSARWRTTTMHQCMTEQARELFDDLEGVSLMEGDRVLLCVGDRLLLQFKKLDADLRTRNYPTATAIAFDDQLPLPGLPRPKLPRVTVGYQPKTDWTEILAITVVHRTRSHPAWHYDLEAPTVTQAVTVIGTGLPESVIVRPRPQQNLFDGLGLKSNGD